METDVFICHASEDKQIVESIEEKFKVYDISIWVDNNEITWGDSITSKINIGLRNSKYVIVIISNAFNLKNWPQTEMNSMLSIEISEGETKLLPLFVGSDEDINALRKEYPLLHSKLFIKWENNADNIAKEMLKKLKKKENQ